MSAFPARTIWSPEQYEGESEIAIQVSQLASDGVVTRAEERRIAAAWLSFLADAPTPLRRLTVWSRVGQDVVDALAGQPQLEQLSFKYGPYHDLSPLAELGGLEELYLGGAKRVVDLSPLGGLVGLRTLVLDEVYSVTDPSPLGALTGLTSLSYGNGYLGSDRAVRLEDVAWLRPLVGLESLRLPGIILTDPDLSALAALPRLATVFVPLRQRYRAQVVALGETSAAFRALAEQYALLD